MGNQALLDDVELPGQVPTGVVNAQPVEEAQIQVEVIQVTEVVFPHGLCIHVMPAPLGTLLHRPLGKFDRLQTQKNHFDAIACVLEFLQGLPGTGLAEVTLVGKILPAG